MDGEVSPPAPKQPLGADPVPLMRRTDMASPWLPHNCAASSGSHCGGMFAPEAQLRTQCSVLSTQCYAVAPLSCTLSLTAISVTQ